jgi:hypothetical protein
MRRLVGKRDPVTGVQMVTERNMEEYQFQRQLVEKGFVADPLPADQMHIDVTTTNKRSGRLNQTKHFSLRGEGKEEAGWRELEQLLPQIGQAGPTLAGKLLLPGRMVEHNVRSDINLAQSISLGTSDYSSVVHIVSLGRHLNEVVQQTVESRRPAGSHGTNDRPPSTNTFTGVFEKVKLYSMLEPAMALPPELLHMNGVDSSMSEAEWAAIVKENPAIETKSFADYQSGMLSTSTASQLGISAPPPPPPGLSPPTTNHSIGDETSAVRHCSRLAGMLIFFTNCCTP